MIDWASKINYIYSIYNLISRDRIYIIICNLIFRDHFWFTNTRECLHDDCLALVLYTSEAAVFVSFSLVVFSFPAQLYHRAEEALFRTVSGESGSRLVNWVMPNQAERVM